jgi:BclB C-terminal domain-containing protein
MADISLLNPFCDDGEGDGEHGERGKRGKRGRTGATGATGTAPPSIIPYASGVADELVHNLLGILDTGAVIAFGSSVDGVAVDGATIDLTGVGGALLNMAFSLPRDGTLTQLSAFFSNAIAILEAFPAGVSVVVQLYRSTTPDNIFTPVPGASVTLPLPIGGVLINGFSVSGTTALSVPVSNQDRLLLVARLTATPDAIVTVTGYISAGLAIA